MQTWPKVGRPRLQSVRQGSLYPLAASKAAIEKREAEAKAKQSYIQRLYSHAMLGASGERERLQPADAILQNGYISAILPLLGRSDSSYSYGGSMSFD